MALGRKRKHSLHRIAAVVNKEKRAVMEKQIDRVVPPFFFSCFEFLSVILDRGERK